MSNFGFIRNVKPFASLSDEELDYLVSHGSIEEFEPGTRIIARGEAGDSMYVIIAGAVRIPIFDREDRHRFTTHLQQYDIFGEMALLTSQPRNADVFAEGPNRCTCLVLSAEITDRLLRKNPDVARFLTDILNERMLESDLFQSVGKYRLDERIAKGGMATVYIGFHRDLHRQVAIKMLSHRLAYRTAFTRRFQLEARLIAELQHPNIVTVYDTEQAYGTYFIVMEYLSGHDVRQLLLRTGPLACARVRRIVVQVLSALAYAHRRGIVHRDVKPANIFVEANDRVKLVDFGIALADIETDEAEEAAEGTEPGETQAFSGTPHFAPPEVIAGRVPDGRGDLYSLGIATYTMLTGRLPFRGKTSEQVLRQHLTAPVPDIRKIRPEVPDDLVEFIGRATAKRPDDRYASCDEAADFLAGTAADASVPAEARMLAVFHPSAASATVDRVLAETAGALREVDGVRVVLNRVDED